jgi:serralysin
MALTISVTDANKDGTGVDFDAYLSNFDTTYTSSGYGGFINPDEDTGFTGDGYVTTDSATGGGASVIFMADGVFTYDLPTHVVSGDLSSITFGTDTVVDGDNYSNSGDITITGFSNYATSSSDGQIMGDLMDSRITTLKSYLASDSIVFKGSTGDDVFTGYGHADTLSGGKGDDELDGGKGSDDLDGGAGNDDLIGDKGNDAILGAGGKDYIDGGKGTDMLTGGAGKDTFHFAKNTGKDAITDFSAGKAGNDVVEFASGMFDKFSDVLAAARDTDDGVKISYNGGSLLLEGVEIADLNKHDFHLL